MKTQKIKLGIVFLLIIIGTQSCYSPFDDMFCITGSGGIITNDFYLDDFTSIENYTVVDIEIEQGDEQSVMVEGHANMINEISLTVVGGELHIRLKNDCYRSFKLKVYITIPVLEELIVESTGDTEIGGFENLKSLYIKSGSTGDIIGRGAIEVDDRIEIEGNSTGDIKLEVYTQDLLLELRGTGDHEFSGNCKYQDIYMTGTSDYSAFDLESDVCDLVSGGTGDAKVNVSDDLNVTIKSTGDVYYIGNPTITLNDKGVGDFINAN